MSCRIPRAASALISTGLVNAGFLALLLFTLVVALMSLFLPGRDDEMLRNNPALYLDVQSWFMLG